MWLLPIVFAGSIGITETYTSPTMPVVEEKVEMVQSIVSTPNSSPQASQQATEEDNPLCSCVNTARQVFPEAPAINAIDYPLNGTLENGEIIIIKYEKNYHIAPYKVGTSTLYIYNEGNYEPCSKTEREIPIKEPKIEGYFDYDLWLKIQSMSTTTQSILKCESNFNHYKKDGSILKGDAGEFGIAQFQRKTWNWFNKLRAEQGLSKLYDILSPYAQLDMLEWAEKNNLLSHWTCFKK